MDIKINVFVGLLLEKVVFFTMTFCHWLFKSCFLMKNDIGLGKEKKISLQKNFYSFKRHQS